MDVEWYLKQTREVQFLGAWENKNGGVLEERVGECELEEREEDKLSFR